MKKFETIIIINPASDIPATIKRYEDLFIKASVADIPVEVKDEGVKRLAYEVKGHREGYFVVYNWTYPDTTFSTPIEEIERAMRIDDNVLKFMIVRRRDDEPEKDKPKEDKVATPPAKSEQSSMPDAMDVLLGLDSYKEITHTIDRAGGAKSEQPDPESVPDENKHYVYTVLHDWTWGDDMEHASTVTVYSTWDKAKAYYDELKMSEQHEFEDKFRDDPDECEQCEHITPDKTHAVFDIWCADDAGYQTKIELERKKVIE